MRSLKQISLILVLSLFSYSCSNTEDAAVFYSKDEFKKNLIVTVNDVNSLPERLTEVVLSLESSDFFKENLPYLKKLEVVELSYKIKSMEGDAQELSNLNFFLGNLKITENLVEQKLNKGGSQEYKIIDENFLSKIETDLLDQKKMPISYARRVISSKKLQLDLEVSLTVKGIFEDY